MKIKTIWDTRPDRFDERVNQHLEEGWLLGKREVIPDTRNLDDSVLYAELAMLDPAPEVDELPPLDPFEALRAVKEFCDTVDECGTCPLYDWCCQLQKGGDPTDWKLPGEEAPEA